MAIPKAKIDEWTALQARILRKWTDEHGHERIGEEPQHRFVDVREAGRAVEALLREREA